MSTEPVLTLRDLRVTFPSVRGAVQAVRGVDLDVHRGELVGVVGESGSGKSTTFLAAMGLLPAAARVSGSAVVAGTEVIGLGQAGLRAVRGRRIAMVVQDPSSALDPVMRVGAQVVEALRAHQQMSLRAARERAVELLATVGVARPAQRAQQYPHQLSGGMRQRVLIAMAIANEPEVLVADEPTSALDAILQAQMLELIARIRSETGIAVVLVTHDLAALARVADRVVVMYAGRVVEEAGVSAAFADPTHPYTRGLVEALPSPGRGRLVPIPGAPPDARGSAAGCAFAPRCSFARSACLDGDPPLVPVRGSLSACVRAGELVPAVRS